jgi:hypothetical protein
MDAPDTRKSSAITDHPFKPQEKRPWLCGFEYKDRHAASAFTIVLCRLAEAAHAETS